MFEALALLIIGIPIYLFALGIILFLGITVGPILLALFGLLCLCEKIVQRYTD